MTYKLPSGEWKNLSAWQSIEELTNFFIGLEPKEYKISFAPEHGPAILKAIRLAKGYEATAFAKSVLGVSKQRLYEYESGKRFSLDTITKLAESLNQKVMISLEGTSDFTTQLARPKDLYDEVELDDFNIETPENNGH